MSALGHRYLFLNSLGNAHRIDRVRSLIRRETDDTFHSCIDSRIQRIIRSYHVRLYCLHRKELTRWHLLQSCRVEHVVHSHHRILQCRFAAHITDVEFNLVCNFGHTCLEVMTHIILFLPHVPLHQRS